MNEGKSIIDAWSKLTSVMFHARTVATFTDANRVRRSTSNVLQYVFDNFAGLIE